MRFSLRWMKPPVIVAFVSILSLAVLFINVYELQCINKQEKPCAAVNTTAIQPNPSLLKYTVYGKDVDSGHLKHVYAMFSNYGFTRVSYNQSSNWNVMWAHDYPFQKLAVMMKNLKPGQKVNHFPGTGFITNKMDLATTNLTFIPKAFKLPDHKLDFIQYASQNPKKKFVQKSNDHRGIEIKDVSKITLDAGGSFIQEYIDTPLLVDGYKFDIGIYVTITSFDPLRVYIYNGDALFRYCPEKYYPFDEANLNKYVVGDDYLPTWEVPSLKSFYVDLGFSMKESFNGYMKQKGRDPTSIWVQIEEAIRRICLSKEEKIMKYVSLYKQRGSFFEMMRFDFVVDDDLNVFVMEVNMSPNLSSAHFLPNQLLYEQVIHSLFELVGITTMRTSSRQFEVSDKNIMVNPSVCKSCESCLAPECHLCKNCLTSYAMKILKDAYLEHVRKHDCKRIFPVKNLDPKYYTDERLGPENIFMSMWFNEKCKSDFRWC